MSTYPVSSLCSFAPNLILCLLANVLISCGDGRSSSEVACAALTIDSVLDYYQREAFVRVALGAPLEALLHLPNTGFLSSASRAEVSQFLERFPKLVVIGGSVGYETEQGLVQWNEEAETSGSSTLRHWRFRIEPMSDQLGDLVVEEVLECVEQATVVEELRALTFFDQNSNRSRVTLHLKQSQVEQVEWFSFP